MDLSFFNYYEQGMENSKLIVNCYNMFIKVGMSNGEQCL
jgi:hypothetical protein